MRHSELDQSFKGQNINFIGQLEAMGRDHKETLQEAAYAEIEEGADPAALARDPPRYLQDKQEAIKKAEANRSDQHLLPEEVFQKGKLKV